jgi:hypothetical protein
MVDRPHRVLVAPLDDETFRAVAQALLDDDRDTLGAIFTTLAEHLAAHDAAEVKALIEVASGAPVNADQV